MKGEACSDPALEPLFRAMLLLQEKWVLFIVRDLLEGPLGFNELTRKGPVNPTTMAQRLDLLEQEGLVTRTVHSAIPPKTSYALTAKGLALAPVLKAIKIWAEAHPGASLPGPLAQQMPCAEPQPQTPAKSRRKSP